MQKKLWIFYGVIAVIAAAMATFFRHVADGVADTPMPLVKQAGAEVASVFFPIENDLEMTRQDGKTVKLSDLRGKVVVLAEFFATCPECAIRNGMELKEIEEHFGKDPNFRMVCISVDPETDQLQQLQDYAKVMNANVEQWWFTRTDDLTRTHEYLEKELKFFQIRERQDPVDIASNGRYSHDLGLMVIDKEFNVVGKWPLADARSEEGRERDPQLYERLHAQMFEQIRGLLDKPGVATGLTAGAD